MCIKNLTGLEKPTMKLIETVSEGFGVVGNCLFEFDVRKIKRTGEAEAEIEKKKIISRAEGQGEAIKILNRAGKRFCLEQYNKQINLENIIVETKKDLEGKIVSEESVEKDWTMKFLDTAQYISREDLQSVLAKILSGEIQRPGSFSYQTLEIVRFLSKRDLEIFEKFVAISGAGIFFVLGSEKEESFEKYGLTYSELLRLSGRGLFNQSNTLGYGHVFSASESTKLNIGEKIFLITNISKEEKCLDIPCHFFTETGRELYCLLLDSASNKKYKEFEKDFITEIEKQGFKIKLKKNSEN